MKTSCLVVSAIVIACWQVRRKRRGACEARGSESLG